MKIKLLSTFVLFSSQISFSQTISGKIVFNNYAISKVDIINVSSKDISISDANGYFSIDAKMNDTLVFIAKNYDIKKIIMNPLITNDKILIIELTLKAEELKEVVISKIENKTTWLSKEEIEQIKLNSSRPKQGLKIIDYKESTILFGVDFIRLSKQARKLFKKEETSKTESPKTNFKDFIRENCKQSFFLESLKLKPDEIELFLNYCDADSNAETTVASNNILVTMDFLFKKNLEFKKLHTSE